MLILLAQRQRTDAVVQRLYLSRDNVHTNFRNAIRGLGARNRVHPVALAAALGEIELPRPWEGGLKRDEPDRRRDGRVRN